ncbi:MAG: hypothetical protein IJE63_06375 [Clostridia bacterium]|nr:hypothetical protein [Clostridia bacterium]
MKVLLLFGIIKEKGEKDVKRKLIPLFLAVMFLFSACSNEPIQDETTQPTTEEKPVVVPAEEFYKADLTAESWIMSEDMKRFYIGDESPETLAAFEEEYVFADTISRTYEVTLGLSESERYLHTKLLVYDDGDFEPTHENDLPLHSYSHNEHLTVSVWVPESYVEDFYNKFTFEYIMEESGFNVAEETDENNRIRAEEMFLQYCEDDEAAKGSICVGRYDSGSYSPDSGSRYLNGGYVYCYMRGHFNYVSPEHNSIYFCLMGSDMGLVWKDGIHFDDDKAEEFAKSVLGDRVEYCEYALLEGYYAFNPMEEQSFYVNWTCDKIYISSNNTDFSDTFQEIYPNDTVGFFD